MESNEGMLKIGFPIFTNLLMSIGSYFLTVRLIPSMENMFLKANLYGIDLNKKTNTKM